ncbi:Uncharacterised protein [Legionella donaldsonii]|uniref:Uncharacterized protein n=1 Tax=Legionella donaldsonii TaxID=45060 RepID=A0A378JB01_9GAMM|nr:hypothetical protein [Legionella donaldsonii]STX44161.1 Uncharacterised protein [Legionella donaldsonii]
MIPGNPFNGNTAVIVIPRAWDEALGPQCLALGTNPIDKKRCFYDVTVDGGECIGLLTWLESVGLGCRLTLLSLELVV